MAIAAPRVSDIINKEEGTEEGVSAITVEGVEVMTEDLVTYVEFIGNTFSNKTVPIIPSIPAEVLSIDVSVGDFVEVGDVLFTLDASNIEAQVTAAEFGVEQANAALSSAGVGINNAKAGIASAELAYEMAKSNYDMNLSNYQFSLDNLAKYEQLYNEGIVSEMEYNQMKLQAAPETMDLLEKQLEQAEQGLAQAKLGNDSANAGYSQANVGVKQAKDGLETANEALEDLVVTATVSGYITAQNLTENVIASNASVAMMIDELQKIKVTTSVTANQVGDIKVGDLVEVIISSTDKTYTGTVSEVSLSADARTMLYPIAVTVQNQNLEIKPGMFATIRIVNGQASNALTVPTEAVVVRDGKDVVFVKTDDSDTAVAVEVVKGLDTGYYIEIISGLNLGDIVVTKGVGLINESTVIKVVRGDE